MVKKTRQFVEFFLLVLFGNMGPYTEAIFGYVDPKN